MKVIICGAGQVGWQIAHYLASEKNDITIIDNDRALVQRATDSLDVNGVIGFASHPDSLLRAGAENADMIIAATSLDEVNMVTCQVAHSLFAVPRKIARLRTGSYRDPRYRELYRDDRLPIDVIINPEKEVANTALRCFMSPTTYDSEVFLGGKGLLLGLVLDQECPVLNMPLRELSNLFSTLGAVVLAVRRNGKLFTASSDTRLLIDDQIYIFVTREDSGRALESFGKQNNESKSLIIVGGGNVGLDVAQALESEKKRPRVRVIERNPLIAEHAAEALHRTIVLNGDGLNKNMLEEANVTSSDTILAVTDDDKTNLLVAVRGKSMGCKTAISLINDPSLLPLLNDLHIDAYINPRAVTISSILRHVRRARPKLVYTIGDNEAEVIEVRVLPSAPIAGHTIRDAELPENTRIGAVLKNNEIFKPHPDLRIEEKDILIIFLLSSQINQIENLLQASSYASPKSKKTNGLS